MANSFPFAVDVDSVLDAHLSSVACIFERGASASLDGLMCGIGPRGHKLFLASVSSPDHPDVTFGIRFPRGITVGALLETLLDEGTFDAIWLLGMARAKVIDLDVSRDLLDRYLNEKDADQRTHLI